MVSGSRAVHYSLRHRLTAAVSQGLFRDVEYTVRHGLIKGMRRKGGLGWLPEWFPGAGAKTPETLFWESLDLRGKVVWDVGAFEGLLTLFFARQASHVVAWEPNPATRQRLEENLALNGITNVTVRPVGIGREAGTLTLVEDPLMPGGASADAALRSQILDTVRESRSAQIEIVTLDSEYTARDMPLPDFVKIDVEGMELPVLEGARTLLSEHNPSLLIEMHGPTEQAKLENAIAVLRLLGSLGYERIMHLESRMVVKADEEGANKAKRGHLVSCNSDYGHKS